MRTSQTFLFFHYHSVGTKTKGQPNIVPLEPEASLVVEAFDLVHLGHDRPSAVLRKVTPMGLRSKKGKRITLHVFLKMLCNPVYIGEMKSKKWGRGRVYMTYRQRARLPQRSIDPERQKAHCCSLPA